MNQKALLASLALWKRRVAYRQRKVVFIKTKSKASPAEKAIRLKKWEKLLADAEHTVARRQTQIAAHKPLRLHALDEMRKLVGVMEHGGNNQGAEVTKIIRANQGTGPEPWCGDTVAYAYRKAGSKVVQRGWAAVNNLGYLVGMHPIRNPSPGDIVVYNFGHTGIFVRWLTNGNFEAIEGNTGASGAVSDSTTGGDGVYLKVRNRAQVSRWVRVVR